MVEVKTKVLYRRDYRTDLGYREAIDVAYVYLNGWEIVKEVEGLEEGYIYTVLIKEV